MKKIMIILITGLLFVTACSGDNAEQTESEGDHAIAVQVEEIRADNLNIEKEFFGRTMPKEVTPVIAQAVGEVQEVHVANGDQVEEDDLLFTMVSMENGFELEIQAPADGYVSDLEVAERSIVTNEDPALLIVDLSKLTINLSVTGDQLDLFEIDDEVTVTSNENENITAIVVDKSLLPGETGLFDLSIELDNDYDWKAGSVLTVIVNEETLSDVLIIPTEAIVEQNNQTFVYIVEDSQVTLTEITVLNMQSDVTAIDGDVQAGDQIVTSGQLTLTDGAEVNVIEEGDPS